jgi:hypothetical protein
MAETAMRPDAALARTATRRQSSAVTLDAERVPPFS